MKKFLSLLLVFVMLLGVLCSCNDTNKNTNIPSDDANAPSTKPQAEIAMEMYEAAIKDEICVFDKDSGEIKLKECRLPTDNTTLGECEILYKAILDLDGDGINEYVIQSEAKDHIVLRYYDGLVYSYCFGSMDLYNLNTDGSFYWIDSYELTNCTRGYNQISFEGASLSIKEIYKIKQTSPYDYGDGTHEYYVGGKQITREEFLDDYAHKSKDLVIFSPLDISCEYPISSEKAFELASNYWKLKNGRTEGSAGHYHLLRIAILEKPNEDTQIYRIGEQWETYNNHVIDGPFAQPPQSVSIYEELFVDAITGECFEESKPSDEEKPNDQVTEDNTVSIGQTQYNFNFDDRIACNGVFYNNDVSYTINQDKDLVLHVNSWNESFVVPKGDMNIVGETVYDSSVVLCEDRGALIFRDYSREEDPIKVIKFVKGNPQVIIEDLSAPLNDCYSEKYCYFINENIGYLFLFNVDASCKVLSEFWKTTDGGQTWIEQSFDGAFDIDWREHIICAKMIDENIGFISAGHRADDNLGRRVYITKDGGKTWEKVWKHKEVGSTEAYDFLYENGQYVILLRSRDTNGKYVFWRYVSTDMKNWSAVAPAYVDLIFCYEDLWDKRLYGDENSDKPSASDYALSKENFDAICKAVSANAIAYAFKDLNNDSADELILLDYEHYLYAIFTLKDGATTLVDTFEYLNHVGAIDENGTIYKSGYGKGDTDYCSVMTLKNDGTLDGLTYGKIDYTDVFDNPPEVTYYQNVSGVYSDITKEEFNSIVAEYEHVFCNMNSLTKSAGLTLHYALEFDPR